MGNKCNQVFLYKMLFIVLISGQLGSGNLPDSLYNASVTKPENHSLSLDASPTQITIFGDVNLAKTALSNSWQGDGSENNPYLIEGLNLNITGLDYGILIEGTSKHIEIKNNVFIGPKETGLSTNYGTITISDVRNIKIMNNYVDRFNKTSNKPTDVGIHILASADCVASNNTISGTNKGVEVDWGNTVTSPYLGNITVTQNEITKSNTGIIFQTYNSLNSYPYMGNNVSYNYISNLSQTAIYMETSYNKIHHNVILNVSGIGIYNAFTNIVNNSMYNNFIANTDFGIGLQGTSNSTIMNNTIYNSKYDGLSISQTSGISKNNIIQFNNFMKNVKLGYYTTDPNSFLNNYWYFCNGVDYNKDGYYDSIFRITADAIDIQPAVKPYSFAEFSSINLIEPINGSISGIVNVKYALPEITFYNSFKLDYPGNYSLEYTCNMGDSWTYIGNTYESHFSWNTSKYPNHKSCKLRVKLDLFEEVSTVSSLFSIYNSKSDFTAPTIIAPSHTQCSGYGCIIYAFVFDSNPSTYFITGNGTLYTERIPWISGALYFRNDELTIGIYNFTIYVYDSQGNFASRIVILEVTDTSISDQPPACTNSPDDLTYDELSSGNEIIWNIVGDKADIIYVIRNEEMLLVNTTLENGDFIVNVDDLLPGIYAFTIYVYNLLGDVCLDTVIVTVNAVENYKPTITHPKDIVFEIGSKGNSISWGVTDINPGVYNVTLNDSLYISDTIWSTGDIIVSLEGLEIGVYNLTIYIYDTKGKMATDSVIISVIDEDNDDPIISSLEDTRYIKGSTGNNLIWQVNDKNPWVYNITIDGQPYLINSPWSNGEIIVNIDKLEEGSYNFTIDVYDILGNQASNSILVTVYVKSATISLNYGISFTYATLFLSSGFFYKRRQKIY